MTNDTRDDGPLSGGIGIGMMWDAEGNVVPPLTAEHERLHGEVQEARRRWEQSGLDTDYDRFYGKLPTNIRSASGSPP